MKFLATLLSTALFATSISAAPADAPAFRRGLPGRVARRAAFSHLTHPMIPLTTPDIEPPVNVSQIKYSSNWAGAVLESPPSGQTFDGVSGRFVVPTPKKGSGSESSWSASAWVGIDGDTSGNDILQAGVDFTISSGGSVSYDAWYEWYPDYAYDFSGIPISAGDTIAITITSSKSSSGKVVMENVSTGTTVSKSLTAPSSSSDLAGQNAEWIVEDYDSGGSPVPLANFGTVIFTDAQAKTSSETVGTTGATILEMEDSNDNVITTVTVPSSSEVKVVYV